jgi:hypothetical protein
MGVVNTTYTFTSTDTITSAKMNNIIDDTTFTGDAIQGTTLQVVSPGKLAVSASGITSNELASNAVVTAKIADSNVTTAKIADSNVTTAKIADSNVTTAKIADSNVTQAKLGTNVAGNGPAFRAWASSQTPITGTVFTKVTLATEDFDTNNNFSSSRFTPTVAGYYQINGSVYNAAGTPFLQAVLYKNGAANSSGTGVGSAYISQSSDIIYLNGTTDYIELYGYSASTTNIDTGQNATFMSGCLIRSA